jgi:hypothetical protein
VGFKSLKSLNWTNVYPYNNNNNNNSNNNKKSNKVKNKPLELYELAGKKIFSHMCDDMRGEEDDIPYCSSYRVVLHKWVVLMAIVVPPCNCRCPVVVFRA